MAIETAPSESSASDIGDGETSTRQSQPEKFGSERLIDLKTEIAKPEVAGGIRDHLEGLLRESKPYEAALYLAEMHRAGIRLKKDGVNHQRVKKVLMQTLESEIAQRNQERGENGDSEELAWINTAKLAARMRVVGMLDVEKDLPEEIREKMKSEFAHALEHPSDEQDLTSYAMYLRTLRIKRTLTESEKANLVAQVDHKLTQPDVTFTQASLQRGRLRSLKCETNFTREERAQYSDDNFWNGLTEEERLRHRYIVDKFHSPENNKFALSQDDRQILRELPGRLQSNHSFRSYPQAVGDIRAFDREAAGKNTDADEDLVVLRRPDGTEVGTIPKDHVLDLEMTDDDYKDFAGELPAAEPELNATEPALGEQIPPDVVQSPAAMTSTFDGEIVGPVDEESTNYGGSHLAQHPKLTSTVEEHGALPDENTSASTTIPVEATNPAETHIPETVETTWGEENSNTNESRTAEPAPVNEEHADLLRQLEQLSRIKGVEFPERDAKTGRELTLAEQIEYARKGITYEGEDPVGLRLFKAKRDHGIEAPTTGKTGKPLSLFEQWEFVRQELAKPENERAKAKDSAETTEDTVVTNSAETDTVRAGGVPPANKIDVETGVEYAWDSKAGEYVEVGDASDVLASIEKATGKPVSRATQIKHAIEHPETAQEAKLVPREKRPTELILADAPRTRAASKEKKKKDKGRKGDRKKAQKQKKSDGEALLDLLSTVSEDEIRERRVAKDKYETPEPRSLNREQMKTVKLSSREQQEDTLPEPKGTGDFISELMDVNETASRDDVADLAQETLDGDLEALLGKLTRKQKQRIRERLKELKDHHGIETPDKDHSTGRSISLIDRLQDAERQLNKLNRDETVE